MRLSTAERRAADLEGKVKRLFRVLVMEGRVGETFPATITGISQNGLWIQLETVFADGLIPMSKLPDDQYRFDTRKNSLVGRRMRFEIGIGMSLQVQLVRADRLSQELEFAVHEWSPPRGKGRGDHPPRRAASLMRRR